jgi:hypothetical protein
MDYGFQGFETPAATARMPAMTTDVPSAAPALTNAIAALTGTRIRQLPLKNTIKVA